MKICKIDKVVHDVYDPNAPGGMKTLVEHKLSDTSTISFAGPDAAGNPPEHDDDDNPVPVTYERDNDGTFEVPDHVAAHLTGGTTGNGFPGWVAWTGQKLHEMVSGPEAESEVEKLRAEIAELREAITSPPAKTTAAAKKAAATASS